MNYFWLWDNYPMNAEYIGEQLGVDPGDVAVIADWLGVDSANIPLLDAGSIHMILNPNGERYVFERFNRDK